MIFSRQRPSSSSYSSAAASSSGQELHLPGQSSQANWMHQPVYGYDTHSTAPPMPTTETVWHTPHESLGNRNQRVFHTQLFKAVTRGHGPTQQTQLQVTEIDQAGTERVRRPELFFHGIVGHVRDHWGGYIDGWKEAARISNYWRRYFNIEEAAYKFQQSGDQTQSHTQEPPSQ